MKPSSTGGIANDCGVEIPEGGRPKTWNEMAPEKNI